MSSRKVTWASRFGFGISGSIYTIVIWKDPGPWYASCVVVGGLGLGIFAEVKARRRKARISD
ncbi:MAG: hypothetical protein HKL80_06110 [Acidimicrobiales bacterium]|nr:hypothetical protein [Acidimicrobiales bacterium]